MRIPITVIPNDQPEETMPPGETAESDQNLPLHSHRDVALRDDTPYVRLKADYENLRKRCDREASQQAEKELGAFLTKFLSIYDDFERALDYSKSFGPAEPAGDLAEGIRLIEKRFQALLRDYQVERIEAVGKKFDPLYHEAVLMEPGSGHDHNTVKREILPGYLFRNKLLRPARVSVAR